MTNTTKLTPEEVAELEKLHKRLVLALEVLEEEPAPEKMESSAYPVLIF